MWIDASQARAKELIGLKNNVQIYYYFFILFYFVVVIVTIIIITEKS